MRATVVRGDDRVDPVEVARSRRRGGRAPDGAARRRRLPSRRSSSRTARPCSRGTSESTRNTPSPAANAGRPCRRRDSRTRGRTSPARGPPSIVASPAPWRRSQSRKSSSSTRPNPPGCSSRPSAVTPRRTVTTRSTAVEARAATRPRVDASRSATRPIPTAHELRRGPSRARPVRRAAARWYGSGPSHVSTEPLACSNTPTSGAGRERVAPRADRTARVGARPVELLVALADQSERVVVVPRPHVQAVLEDPAIGAAGARALAAEEPAALVEADRVEAVPPSRAAQLPRRGHARPCRRPGWPPVHRDRARARGRRGRSRRR